MHAYDERGCVGRGRGARADGAGTARPTRDARASKRPAELPGIPQQPQELLYPQCDPAVSEKAQLHARVLQLIGTAGSAGRDKGTGDEHTPNHHRRDNALQMRAPDGGGARPTRDARASRRAAELFRIPQQLQEPLCPHCDSAASEKAQLHARMLQTIGTAGSADREKGTGDEHTPDDHRRDNALQMRAPDGHRS